MARVEHLDIVRNGARALAKWQEENPHVRRSIKLTEELAQLSVSEVRTWRLNNPDDYLDLTAADLRNVRELGSLNLSLALMDCCNLSNLKLKDANWIGVSLKDAILDQAYFESADLRVCDLRGTSVTRTAFTRANLDGSQFFDAKGDSPIFESARFSNGTFARCSFQTPNFKYATLTNSSFVTCNFPSALFTGANCEECLLHLSNFTQADFSSANMKRVSLRASNMKGVILSNTSFQEVRELSSTTGLEFSESRNRGVTHLESIETTWVDRHLNWERLRTVGGLPLFGVSYATLIVIPLIMYLFAGYNAHIEQVQEIGEEFLRQIPSEVNNRTLLKVLATKLANVPKAELRINVWLLFPATVILAIASTMYTFAGPSQIKEFSRDQWIYQLNRPEIQYLALSWKGGKWGKTARWICAVGYVVGGTVVAGILISKLCSAALYIYSHASFSWH